MIYTPTAEHEASAALCAEIAKRSHGVCFLGFSGGKDGLCAWLNLRRYFKRIIPFHCCGFPGMRFRERALEYYEFEFQTRILRLLGEETSTILERRNPCVPNGFGSSRPRRYQRTKRRESSTIRGDTARRLTSAPADAEGRS